MKAACVVLALGLALAASAPAQKETSSMNARAAKPSSPGVAATEAWQVKDTLALKGVSVEFFQPVLVARRADYLWFPTLTLLSDSRLMAQMSGYADVHAKTTKGLFAFSADGGLTWTGGRPASSTRPGASDVAGPLLEAAYGESTLTLPSGDQLLLPYYLYPRPGGTLGAPYQVVPKGKAEVRVVPDGVSVTGWPRPDKSFAPDLGLAGFVFNGQTVKLKDGGYLATLYGHFRDTNRYSLVLAESADGVNWKVRSIIADETCKLPGGEGPCESAVVRLKDDRLMCVFRLAGSAKYGQTYSRDEGKTWSEPVGMKGQFSVQPSLAVMADGAVVLSGGRPGLFAWLNLDGAGQDWQEIDLRRHHNACVQEKIDRADRTSSYTEVLALDGSGLLVIYDRIPHGWSAIPKGSPDTNSVWVVRIGLKRH